MKRSIKRVLSVLMTLFLLAACCTAAAAEGAAPAEKTLKFGEDGKFTILHLTDTQDDQYPAHALSSFLTQAIAMSNPDLIIFTGDMVEDSRIGDPGVDDCGLWEGVKVPGNEEKTRENAFKAADYVLAILDSSGVPFAVTQGNNDYKVGVSNSEWLDFYSNYENNVTVDMSAQSEGIDYRLPIYGSDGKDVRFNLYCIDSAEHMTRPESVEWYVSESNAQKQANGKTVPAFAFQHIPVDEVSQLFTPCDRNDPDGVLIADFNAFRYYKLAEGAHGYFNTVYHSETGGCDEFHAWKQQGDVIAAFFGHMHQDGFSGVYDGIELNMTYGCEFSKDGPYGVRVITLDENDVTHYENRIYTFDKNAVDGGFVADPYDAPQKTLIEKVKLFFDSLFYVLKTIIRKVLPI